MGGNHIKGKKHTPDQVIAKLAEGDRMLNEGKTIAEVARSACLTETTWHRWKNTYGGMRKPSVYLLEGAVVDPSCYPCVWGSNKLK